jgi:hypothetical protein
LLFLFSALERISNIAGKAIKKSKLCVLKSSLNITRPLRWINNDSRWAASVLRSPCFVDAARKRKWPAVKCQDLCKYQALYGQSVQIRGMTDNKVVMANVIPSLPRC